MTVPYRAKVQWEDRLSDWMTVIDHIVVPSEKPPLRAIVMTQAGSVMDVPIHYLRQAEPPVLTHTPYIAPEYRTPADGDSAEAQPDGEASTLVEESIPKPPEFDPLPTRQGEYIPVGDNYVHAEERGKLTEPWS